MIELTEAIILNKNAPKEEVSFSLEKGDVVTIPYTERYKFELLALRNQSLDKGTFKIDDVVIFPDENNDKTIFFLAVNSLVKVGLCFLVEKTAKKQMVNNIQSELIKLRELPTETEEQKNEKIAAIFNKIAEFSPSYVLINLNEEVNKNNPELERQVNMYKSTLLIVELEVKPIQHVSEEETTLIEEDEYEMTSLNIGDGNAIQTYEKESSSNDFLVFGSEKDSFAKAMLITIKSNLMVFLSFLIPTIGVIAFVLLSPLYAQTSNKVLIIPFVITIVICFVLYMLMTYKCCSFHMLKNKKKKNRRMIMFVIINLIVTAIGAGFGILIYVLFKNFDSDLKEIKNNTIGIVIAILLFLILVTACLYLTPVINKIKAAFKKKK